MSETKKRKLKPLKHRKPERLMKKRDILQHISGKTGFSQGDINTVLDEYHVFLKDQLINKGAILLPGIGDLFAIVKPSRIGVDMNGGVEPYKKVKVPAMWRIRFSLNVNFHQLLKGMEVTKEEEDAIYVQE